MNKILINLIVYVILLCILYNIISYCLFEFINTYWYEDDTDTIIQNFFISIAFSIPIAYLLTIKVSNLIGLKNKK